MELWHARTLCDCIATGRFESQIRRWRTMLGIHEVSRRIAALRGFVVVALPRRAENSSMRWRIGRSGTIDVDDRDSQGHPCTRGKVPSRTSRPRAQRGHAVGSGVTGPCASDASQPFGTTACDASGSVDAQIGRAHV